MTSITQDGQVEFRFFRPNVASVALVGDFNNWDEQNLAMKSDGSGWWTALLQFASGDYRFRYLADGKWFIDFASFGVEVTKNGFDSILRVPEILAEGSKFNAKQVA